jgi:hypothetical protein
MSQVVLFVQQLIGSISCRRRHPAQTPVEIKEALGLGTKSSKKYAASQGFRSDESTDIGPDPTIMSTIGSDIEIVSSSGSLTQRSPKVKPPPGLESLRDRSSRTTHYKGESSSKLDLPWRRGVEAREVGCDTKPKPPNLEKKGHQLAECLREITTSGREVPSSLEEVLKRRLQRENSETQKTQLPHGLHNVLGKLTPADAAIVMAAFESRPGAPRLSRRANIGADSLRANLQKLANIDSKRVFMVRKIANLGLDSPELLKTHFSKFGNIEDVLITHSIEKKDMHLDDPLATPGVRPASIGFVVMETADDVVNIFKQGLEHTVSDVKIALTAYEHHDPAAVIQNESRFGLPPSGDKPRHGRFPTYANITEDNTMKANLRKMAEFDANRIFMVRKINKLGLGSCQLLKNHFGQFGRVSNVFVTHSIDRRKIDHQDPNARPQVRPAGIGFVVMDKAEDVVAIFENGMQQTLYGVQICLAEYQHQLPDEAVVEDRCIEDSTS